MKDKELNLDELTKLIGVEAAEKANQSTALIFETRTLSGQKIQISPNTLLAKICNHENTFLLISKLQTN